MAVARALRRTAFAEAQSGKNTKKVAPIRRLA
jgi:hypothetical protein